MLLSKTLPNLYLVIVSETRVQYTFKIKCNFGIRASYNITESKNEFTCLKLDWITFYDMGCHISGCSIDNGCNKIPKFIYLSYWMIQGVKSIASVALILIASIAKILVASLFVVPSHCIRCRFNGLMYSQCIDIYHKLTITWVLRLRHNSQMFPIQNGLLYILLSCNHQLFSFTAMRFVHTCVWFTHHLLA